MEQPNKPVVELELGDDVLGYKWRAPILEKRLLYLVDRCIGCGLCADVCPVQAISMGPVKEIASGRLKAPYIIIDETRCVVCPLCSAMCPSNALKVEVPSDFEHPKVKGSITVDEEKCIPCLLCEKVCPREAIKAEVKLKRKEELVKYPELSERRPKGTVKVNQDKCCYCGLCELLCDAVKIEWVKPQPPKFKAGASVSIDESKCDYCGLCGKICPVEAIKVECSESAPRKVLEPSVEGSITVDEEKCVHCGLCGGLCPAQAIRVEKPFKGRVYMVEPNSCDPSGCKNCINVCPSKVVYVARPPSKDKMLFAEDYCIYCGACERACPVDAIRVVREGLNLQGPKSPWLAMSLEHFERALSRRKPRKPGVYHRPVKLVEEERAAMPSPPMPPPSKGYEKAAKAADALIALLSGVPERILFEKGQVDKLTARLRGKKVV